MLLLSYTPSSQNLPSMVFSHSLLFSLTILNLYYLYRCWWHHSTYCEGQKHASAGHTYCTCWKQDRIGRAEDCLHCWWYLRTVFLFCTRTIILPQHLTTPVHHNTQTQHTPTGVAKGDQYGIAFLEWCVPIINFVVLCVLTDKAKQVHLKEGSIQT